MTGPIVCAGCGTEVADNFLACPACHTLVHATRLKEISELAAQARDRGDVATEAESWQEALRLLPRGSRQHQAIAARVEELADAPRRPGGGVPAGSWLQRSWGALVAVGVLVLTKGKLLLSGLLKLPTLFSMLAAFGVYWTIWGWKFALGVILTTYVHEMGHVAALVRYGIKASAPMFVPGLGAYVRLHQHPPTARQDARVGLAGPLWGLAAGLVCFGVGTVARSDIWLAIAHVTAVINLFNLLPIWQLDGGRAFSSMNTTDRWLAVAGLAVAWYFSNQGLIVLIALVAGWQAFQRNEVPSDRGATALFAGLAIALGWLAGVDVTLPTP